MIEKHSKMFESSVEDQSNNSKNHINIKLNPQDGDKVKSHISTLCKTRLTCCSIAFCLATSNISLEISEALNRFIAFSQTNSHFASPTA